MIRKGLGGKYGSLYVNETKDRYYFYNRNYSMEFTLYKEDVNDYLSNPYLTRWGLFSRSNTVADEDRAMIKEYLIGKSRKYKTVTEVLKSRSRKKEKILREEFSLNELVEYKIGKEKANGKVESCC